MERRQPKPEGAHSRDLWMWALYDWATQSHATVIQTFVFAAYFTNRVAGSTEHGNTKWSLTIRLTRFCVALRGPFLGAVADRAGPPLAKSQAVSKNCGFPFNVLSLRQL